MFCKICGRTVDETDIFCRSCGARLKEDKQENQPVEEVIYNPPFEDKQSIHNIVSGDDEGKPQEFKWDVYEFPKHRKTDSINFTWDTNDNQPKVQRRAYAVDSRKPSDDSIDKFFTFTKKNEEFQELLNREYEKIKEKESGPVAQADDEDVTNMDQQKERSLFVPAQTEKEHESEADMSEKVPPLKSGSGTGLEDSYIFPTPSYRFQEEKAVSEKPADEPVDDEIRDGRTEAKPEPEAGKVFEPYEEYDPDSLEAWIFQENGGIPLTEEQLEQTRKLQEALVAKRALEAQEALQALQKTHDAQKKLESKRRRNDLEAMEAARDEYFHHVDGEENREPEIQESALLKQKLASLAGQNHDDFKLPGDILGTGDKNSWAEQAEGELVSGREEANAEIEGGYRGMKSMGPESGIGSLLEQIEKINGNDSEAGESGVKPLIDQVKNKGSQENEEDEEEEEIPLYWQRQIKEKKGFKGGGPGKAAKIILIVVVVILVGELAALGIVRFMPESAAAQLFFRVQNKVTGLFTGGDEEEDPNGGGDGANLEEYEMSFTREETIRRQLSNNYNENIQAIEANDNLKYDPDFDYSELNPEVEGINDLLKNTGEIKENFWYLSDDEIPYYRDVTAVGTIIFFDALWVEYVNEGAEGIFSMVMPDSPAYERVRAYAPQSGETKAFNRLEIGEIRQDENQFFVWAKEEITTTVNGSSTTDERYWIYHIEITDRLMKIVNYYTFDDGQPAA